MFSPHTPRDVRMCCGGADVPRQSSSGSSSPPVVATRAKFTTSCAVAASGNKYLSLYDPSRQNSSIRQAQSAKGGAYLGYVGAQSNVLVP